jgi:hypothetical protein
MTFLDLRRTFCGLWMASCLASCDELTVTDAGAGNESPREDAGRAASGSTRDAQIKPDASCATCSTVPPHGDAVAPAKADARAVAELDAGVPVSADSLVSDSGVGANGRPLGVALCYSAASDVHTATTQFWDVLRRGDLDARAGAIDALKAAAMAEPADEEFALLLGLASLWRVAEPLTLESLNLVLTLDSITTAQTSLELAYKLCPTDHRLPAWLGPIKIRMGRMNDDTSLVDAGFSVLNQGIEHYPGFVLFSKFLVYADLPATDPEFMNAVEAVRSNAVYCGTVETGLFSDPACHNHARASHNIEGAAVFLGDMYAKAQDRAAALAAYGMAKKTDTWSTWDYQALLDERISTLDKRMKATATASTTDDLEPAWASQIQCSLCHRD